MAGGLLQEQVHDQGGGEGELQLSPHCLCIFLGSMAGELLPEQVHDQERVRRGRNQKRG